MKITFVVSTLACGGAERVAQVLSKALQERGNRVTVITTKSADDFYNLAGDVQRVRFSLTGEGANSERGDRTLRQYLASARRLPSLRKAILSTNPDVVVSFGDEINVLTLLALAGHVVPVVGSEHVNPRFGTLGPHWRVLRRMLYPNLSCLVSVSRGVDEHFSWLTSVPRSVIHNPISLCEEARPLKDHGLPCARPFICAMGRLVPQKGHDLLLRAFALARIPYPEWSLVVLGEGPQRSSLESLAVQLDLQRNTHFPGAFGNPFPVVRRAEFFVMSSRFEGFGNVLVEAMLCGLPVVSFDCPSGPSEIIEPGMNGELVPPGDVSALARVMRKFMSDASTRASMARNALSSASQWNPASIAAQWEQVLEQAMSNRPSSVG